MKYYLCWDVPATRTHTHRYGVTSVYSIDVSKEVVTSMNERYGEDTHWIIDSRGDKVWPVADKGDTA